MKEFYDGTKKELPNLKTVKVAAQISFLLLAEEKPVWLANV